MNLVTINDGEAVTMTSLEIAGLVEKRHDNVKRTIEILQQQGVIARPQIEDVQEVGGNNRTYTTQVYCFIGERGKRDSIIVVAQLCPEFTARLVDRWQELEAKAVQPAIPQTLPEALRLAAEAIEKSEKMALENKAQAEALTEQAPKVAFAMQVEVAPDAIDVCKAAKLLGTGRNRLMQFLREKHWVTRYNQPYQDKIDSGLLDTKLSRPYEHPERGLQQSITTIVTGKGLVKLRQLWDERQQAISDVWAMSKAMPHQGGRDAR